MKYFFFLMLSLFTLGEIPSQAAVCGDSCNTSSDCVYGCQVCESGFCLDCDALGDQATCEDAGTGAATYCVWAGGYCATVMPEFPHPLVPYLLVLGSVLVLGILYKKSRKRCGA